MHDVVSDLCHASSLDAWRKNQRCSKVSAVSGTEGGGGVGFVPNKIFEK